MLRRTQNKWECPSRRLSAGSSSSGSPGTWKRCCFVAWAPGLADFGSSMTRSRSWWQSSAIRTVQFGRQCGVQRLRTRPLPEALSSRGTALETQAEAARQRYAASADIDIDVKRNRVLVLLAEDSSLAPAVTSASPESSAVEVREVPQLARPAADIYGGLALSGGCTTACSVRQTSTGTTGVLTAAHCSNTQSYCGTSLPFVKGQQFADVDAQWHTTPGFTDVGKFRISTSTTRNVTGQTSQGSVATGTWICKYGNVTAYGCGELTTKSYSPTWVDKGRYFGRITNCSIDLSTPGDSGGSVFINGVAVGVISGWYSDLFCAEDQSILGFMDGVTNALGVTVVVPWAASELVPGAGGMLASTSPTRVRLPDQERRRVWACSLA